jgi:hypothetical protein
MLVNRTLGFDPTKCPMVQDQQYDNNYLNTLLSPHLQKGAGSKHFPKQSNAYGSWQARFVQLIDCD